VIAERDKAAAVAAGRWRATRPEVLGHAGFRLNALVSPLANAAWTKLVAEFLEAKKSPDTLQPFVNTILAEGWREAAEESDPSELAGRAENFGLDAIPADSLLVTAGVDVQHDRLECTFLGHGRDGLALVLGHVVIWGSPGDESTWQELDALLRSTWRHPAGGTLRVDAAAIDSGDGAWTQKVYDFTRARFARKVLAVKGASGNRPPLTRATTKGAILFIAGVDGLKSQIFQRLARGRTIRFSDRLEAEYFEQVASERVVIRYVRGVPVRQFVRVPGRRAEALDCLVYALAARHVLTVNLDRRAEELASQAAPKAPPRVIRSTWLDRGRA
jgi:phage terminase large subunit GpA-like protein